MILKQFEQLYRHTIACFIASVRDRDRDTERQTEIETDGNTQTDRQRQRDRDRRITAMCDTQTV